MIKRILRLVNMNSLQIDIFLSNVYVPCFNFRNNKRNPKDFNIYFVKCLFHRVNTTVKKNKKTSEQTTGC